MPGSRRYVSYTNIGGGTYEFQVKVRNDTEPWSKSIADLGIVVKAPVWHKGWFWIAMLFFFIGISYLIYRKRIKTVRQQAELELGYKRKLAELEMQALRAQMNPHFLFNSLNSIKYYIIKKEPVKAAEYIDNFSRLIRLILKNSREQLITLQQELEALDLYINIERMRFEEKFNYNLSIDSSVDTAYFRVPPLILQPFVENAIWHGLLHKETPGNLSIIVSQDDKKINIEIEDDGVGRDRAKQLKSKSALKQKSMGMKLTKARMDINKTLTNTDIFVSIIDLKDKFGHSAGTKVVVSLNHPDLV